MTGAFELSRSTIPRFEFTYEKRAFLDEQTQTETIGETKSP